VDEILRCFELTLEIHHTFGFSDFVINLSTQPGVAIGDEEMWAQATGYLRDALEKSGLEYTVAEGEGAFYGPKVDFHARDAIGRLWQLTTVQCDFALPERFDMEYMGEDNERHRPVMIHRAILGTLERFTGVLIEHYAGDFPLWLAPEQVRIIPVADRHVAHCEAMASAWRGRGLRASVDDGRERMQKKIRDAQLMKVPYAIVIGDRDIEAGTIAVRDRAGNEVRGLDPSAFMEAIVAEATSRSVAGVDLQTLAAT
jgi:threonyl-tRNA synthetase